MRARGWEQPDFVLVTGDAYVDHPTFGTAIISRVLEHDGLQVAILSQPDWKDAGFPALRPAPAGLSRLRGEHRLHGGPLHRRPKAPQRRRLFPRGRAGLRPDRAVHRLLQHRRTLYPDVPLIIGGLEASLRRFAHYDYWEDKVRPSILLDRGGPADLRHGGEADRRDRPPPGAGSRLRPLRTCGAPATPSRRGDIPARPGGGMPQL